MRVRRRVLGMRIVPRRDARHRPRVHGCPGRGNPGNQRRDMIRVMGAVFLVVGVALVIPYLRGDGRSGQR